MTLEAEQRVEFVCRRRLPHFGIRVSFSDKPGPQHSRNVAHRTRQHSFEGNPVNLPFRRRFLDPDLHPSPALGGFTHPAVSAIVGSKSKSGTTKPRLRTAILFMSAI